MPAILHAYGRLRGDELGHAQTFSVIAVRALRLRRNECGPGGWDPAVQKLRLCDAEELQLVEGKVDAATPRVLAHVAEDVDQLQRDSQLVGTLQGTRVLETEDAHAHAADDRRHQAAVLAQLI